MELQIRNERKDRDWALSFVGEKIGVSKNTIQMIETGHRKPSYDVMVKLMELYGYSDPRELFRETTTDKLLE